MHLQRGFYATSGEEKMKVPPPKKNGTKERFLFFQYSCPLKLWRVRTSGFVRFIWGSVPVPSMQSLTREIYNHDGINQHANNE